MQLTEITITNFRCFGSTPTTVHLTAMSGRNRAT